MRAWWCSALKTECSTTQLRACLGTTHAGLKAFKRHMQYCKEAQQKKTEHLLCQQHVGERHGICGTRQQGCLNLKQVPACGRRHSVLVTAQTRNSLIGSQRMPPGPPGMPPPPRPLPGISSGCRILHSTHTEHNKAHTMYLVCGLQLIEASA